MSTNSRDHWDWGLIRSRCTAEAVRIVHRRQDAEEVVQEALTRAWRSRRSCRTPEAPLPWCLQITRNEALRLISRQAVLSNREPLGAGDEVQDQKALGEDDRAATRIDLARALQELSPQERLLIVLRYGYDRSHPEIAATLQIPEATARVRLHRAQKRLKSLLDPPP